MMMLTIRNLKKSEVMPLLLALPKQTVFSLEELDSVPTTVKGKVGTKHGKRMSPDTPLILTGKAAQKGTQRERILLEHEKLEKKHGIGSVTRKMLNKQISGLSIDTTVIGQLIKGGFLEAR